MERIHDPIPLNPNAKYLPNSISNVLYSIQKFDQSTLAWPTCQRKTDVSIGKVFTSPPEVPLAGVESCVIQNRRQCESKGNAREVKKNTFYQILQASQDQPCFPQRSRIKRKSIDAKFESDLKDDIIYNDIYDIVRSHTQHSYKRLPQLKKQPEQEKPFSVSPPVVEVYKVRPVATETKEAKGRSCKSTGMTNKLREKTNELSDSKRTTHPSKPKLTESKSSKKKAYKLQENTNELLDLKRSTHPSKPKLTESKSSKKKAYKLQEKTNELLDSKRTTHPSKPKLTESKSSKKKARQLQEKMNKLSDSKRTTLSSKPKLTESKSSKKQLFTFQTRENKHKGTSKSEEHKTIQQLWPLPDRTRDRDDRGQRSMKREQFYASSETKSNFPSIQLPDQDGEKVEKGSTEELGDLEEKLEQRTERTSDIKRNSKEESGKTKRRSKEASKLIPFKADKNITIYIVRRRNSKGKTDISLLSKRSGTDIYRIKEMKLNQSKNQEEIPTLLPKKTDSYFLGRSKKRFYQNRKFALGHSNTNISTLRGSPKNENIPDSTTANNLQKNINNMSITSNGEINSSTAQAKEKIVSKSRNKHSFKGILKVRNGPKTTRKPTGQVEIIASKLSSSPSQISTQKSKPKDSFKENTVLPTLSTDYLQSKTKTTSNVSRIKQRSQFFRHESVPETPINSIDAERESSAVFPYEEHSNDIEDEISFRSGSIYSANRRSFLDRRNFLEKLNLKSRKNSLDSTSKLYQDRLLKLKQFLNRHSVLDNADASSIDIEGIFASDLLLYPYAEIYENKTTITKVKQPNVSKGIKENSTPTLKPLDDEMKSEKPVSRNTACIICRTIRGYQGDKEAPFMEKMRKEQRRRELLAYRANMEEPCIKSFNLTIDLNDLNNKTGPINMHELGKKELYSLESRGGDRKALIL